MSCSRINSIRGYDETEPLASAGLWLSLSCMGTVLIFIVNTFRTGVLIPPPLIGALLVMGLLFIPLANDMPDMGGDVRVSEDARIPDFILHQYGNGSVSLDDLMKGKKAVAIGISFLLQIMHMTKLRNSEMRKNCLVMMLPLCRLLPVMMFVWMI